MKQKCAAALLLCCLLTGHCAAVDTSAASAILVEQKSGRVIYAENPDEERLIASITKIMTALVALEKGDPDAVYTVTEADMAEGSSMYLAPGEQVELRTLLYGLMLSSGNDAALATARCVGGTVERFVGWMNEKAAALGMEHTGFMNPNGLDAEGHYSSARDMAILTAAALENEEFRRIVSTSAVTIGERRLVNHNKLLRLYRGCIGVKTGYTRAAGRTLVSAAEREGMTLVCVTLRDGDDWQDHMGLLDHGFSTVHMTVAAEAGKLLTSVSVRNGTSPSVALAAAEDLSYPTRDDEHLTLTAEGPVSVEAPVVPGQIMGRATAYLNGQPVAAVDLIAAEAVAAKN